MKQVRNHVDYEDLGLFNLPRRLIPVLKLYDLVVLVGAGHRNLELEYASLDCLDDMLSNLVVFY